MNSHSNADEQKLIENARTIAGLLKEAVFLHARLNIATRRFSVDAHIISVVETDLRSNSSDSRALRIELDDTEKRFSPADVLAFELPLSTFVLVGEVKVESVDGKFVTTTFPTSCTFFQRRKVVRQPVKSVGFAPAVICSEKTKREIGLVIFDCSSSGYGAFLKQSSTASCPKIGDKVVGKMPLLSSVASVDCRITYVKLESSKGGLDIYKLGLTDHLEKKLPRRKSGRASKRIEIQRDLVFVSEVTSEEFTIHVLEASFLGFSGVVSTDLNVSIKPGFEYSLKGSDLIFELLEVIGRRLRMQIKRGSAVSKSMWMQTTTLGRGDQYRSVAPELNEMINLFCEAGATTDSIFSRISSYKELFSHNHSSKDVNNNWLFRLISNGDSSRISGHVSAVRLGDNAWCVGDGAGGASDQRRIPKDFFKYFFLSFREFLRALSPVPKTMLMWKSGHPYWKAFDSYINDNPEVVQAKVLLHQTKLGSLETTELEVSSFEVIELKASQRACVQEVIEKVSARGFEKFVDVFDLNEDRFGSPLLRNIQGVSKTILFDRRYFKLRGDRCEFLVILTAIPFGVSINQVSSAAYILPLGEFNAEGEWRGVVKSIHLKMLELGFLPSTIRRVSHSTETYSGEDSTSVAYVLHPDAFLFFSEDKEDEEAA